MTVQEIRTTLVPSGPPPPMPSPTAAVVIDVLRATSVMATAMDQGVASITVTADIDQARRIAADANTPIQTPIISDRRNPRSTANAINRGCCWVASEIADQSTAFDFGNSPREYVGRVADRNLVMTTTNGTAAAVWAASATDLYAMAMVNFSAAINAITRHKRLHLICSGTEGLVSGEDVLCAGAVVQHFCGMANLPGAGGRPLELDDASRIARAYWVDAFGDNSATKILPDEITAELHRTLGGRNLIERGFADDLAFCASVDACPAVPIRTHTGPTRFKRDVAYRSS